MTHHHHAERFPPGLLWAAAGLVLATLIGTMFARATRTGTTTMPPVAAVEARDLRFEDRADGAIVIFRDGGPRFAGLLPAGGNGFLRGVLRGLARERLRQQGIPTAPFRLTRWADGRLTIADPHTGRSVDVGAFGPDNYGIFARVFSNTAPGLQRVATLDHSAALPAARH